MKTYVQPPVVLVHGIWDDSRVFRAWDRCLRARGCAVHTPDLVPPDGSAPLEELAAQLGAEIEDLGTGARGVDVVAFSMGGLVARHYLQRQGGLGRVRRLITLATPHQGTWTALAFPRHPGIRQMLPGSGFLADLNRDRERLHAVGLVSFWTPLDLMIVPAVSSRLPEFPSPALPLAGHAFMLWDGGLMQQVARLLEAEEPRP